MTFLVISFVTFISVYFFLVVLGKNSEPNMLIGYRTKRSMKNEESWLLAQEYFGTLFKKVYLSMTIIGVFLALYEHFANFNFLDSELYGIILVVSSVIPIIIVMYKTENMLKKHERNNIHVKN